MHKQTCILHFIFSPFTYTNNCKNKNQITQVSTTINICDLQYLIPLTLLTVNFVSDGSLFQAVCWGAVYNTVMVMNN